MNYNKGITARVDAFMLSRCSIAFLFLLSSVSAWAEPHVLRVCESDLDYPPFSYLVKDSNGQRHLEGFAINLLQRLVDSTRWNVQFVILPFNRCLRDSADLSAADMILTAINNTEREKLFLASEPFWQAHFHAFYLGSRFPNGLPLVHKDDLRRFHLRGVNGHNVSMFGIPESEMDLGSTSYDAIFRKLHIGRCEVFPYNLEVIEGHRLIGKNWLVNTGIAHQEIPEVDTKPFQMLIARRYAYAVVLQSEINQALQTLQSSGELETLYLSTLQKADKP